MFFVWIEQEWPKAACGRGLSWEMKCIACLYGINSEMREIQTYGSIWSVNYRKLPSISITLLNGGSTLTMILVV
jgi:hypothetical protein